MRGRTITAGSAGLLSEGFDRGRKPRVHREADVGLVDTHSEGLCRHEQPDLVTHEAGDGAALVPHPNGPVEVRWSATRVEADITTSSADAFSDRLDAELAIDMRNKDEARA